MSKHRAILRGQKNRKDEKLVLVLLLVKSSDEQGRPKQCEIGYDENVYTLKGGEEFITAWVPEKCVNKRSN